MMGAGRRGGSLIDVRSSECGMRVGKGGEQVRKADMGQVKLTANKKIC